MMMMKINKLKGFLMIKFQMGGDYGCDLIRNSRIRTFK